MSPNKTVLKTQFDPIKFLEYVINREALRVNLVISPLIAFALLLKRIISKKPIPV